MLLYFDNLDLAMNMIHITIIMINAFGWIFEKTRKLSVFMILITIFCWTILGVFFGLGYCPLTQMHADYLYNNYQYLLPFSYIDYIFITNFGFKVSTKFLSLCSILVVFLSLYLSNLKLKSLTNKMLYLIILNIIIWGFIIIYNELGSNINFNNLNILIGITFSCLLIKEVVIKNIKIKV